MSDYEDYDYGTDAGGDALKQMGLSANTVLQIRKYVLGDYDGPTEPLIEDRPEVLVHMAAQGSDQRPDRRGGSHLVNPAIRRAARRRLLEPILRKVWVEIGQLCRMPPSRHQ